MNSIETTEVKHLPRFVLWGVLCLIVVIICLGLAEIILRIVPGEWSGSFFYVYDPDVGTWHLPSYVGDEIRIDYQIHGIHMNSFGMRDRERTVEKKPGVYRIAVLGDSYVEGMMVADDQVMTRKMEAELGPKFEVMNFGVAGYGSLQEKIVYEKRVRAFKPDLVVVGFLSGNDMRDNSKELSTLYSGAVPEAPFLVRQPDGSWKLDPVPPRPAAQNSLIVFLKRHLALYRFAWFVVRRYSTLVGHGASVVTTTPAENGSATSSARTEQNVDVALFAPPKEQIFKDAWDGTDKIIVDLKNEVEADHAKFLLVGFPSMYHMLPDPRAALEKEYHVPAPADFDVDYPENHLDALSKKNGIEFLSLTPAFRAYRDAHHLTFPYFSFAHDGHWGALGHDLAAKTMDAEMIKRGLIPKP